MTLGGYFCLQGEEFSLVVSQCEVVLGRFTGEAALKHKGCVAAVDGQDVFISKFFTNWRVDLYR
jgi:hypothetical protein